MEKLKDDPACSFWTLGSRRGMAWLPHQSTAAARIWKKKKIGLHVFTLVTFFSKKHFLLQDCLIPPPPVSK